MPRRPILRRSVLRRTVIASALALLAAMPASAQTIYGLFGLPTPDIGRKQIGTLDPTDGAVGLIGTSTSVDTDTVAVGTGITATAVAGDAFYFIGVDAGDATSRVYTVDLSTGTTTASHLLSAYSSGETVGMWYDESTTTLWGLFIDSGDRALATVDPTTGAVGTPINGGIAADALSTAGGVFTGDPDADRVFFIGSNGDGPSVWEVSTLDGSVIPHPLDGFDEGTVQGIEWDALRQTLWMIVHIGGARQLYTYDLEEEEIFQSGDEIDFGDSISTSPGLIALDDATGKLFFIGNGSGSDSDPVPAQGFRVYTVDVTTGLATSRLIDGTSIAINQWAGFEIIPGPEMTLTKDDGGATAVPGDVVTWALTASNAAGAGPAKGVALTETVPEETSYSPPDNPDAWACLPNNSAGSTCTLSLSDIAPDASTMVSFAVKIDPSVRPDLTELSNTATLSATNATDDVQASDTTPVTAAAALTLTKSDGDTTTTPGSTVVYTLTAGNTGNADANTTVLTDTVPQNTTFSSAGSTAGWSCSDGSIAGTVCTFALGTFDGGSQTAVAFAAAVASSVPAGTTAISNSATLSSSTTTSAMASDTTPLTAAPTLQLTKSDGDANATPGGLLSYLLSYSNTGNEDTLNAGLTETVPAQTTFNAAASTAGWVCTPDASPGSSCTLALGTIAGGDGSTATFAVTVDEPVLANTTEISNQADFDADNATATQAADATPVIAAPVLTLTKSDGDIGTAPGSMMTYVLIYANDGNENAADTAITDVVPANTTYVAAASSPGWTCTPDANAGSTCTYDIGALLGGDSALVFFAVTVDDPLPADTTAIGNTASIGASNVGAPTVVVENTSVTAEPDLTLTKSDGDITANPGSVVPYALSYGNDGNEGAANVQLIETVPANSTFSAGSSTAGWICTPDINAGSTCTLDVGTVAGDGGSGSATFAVQVANPFPGGDGALSNQATVSASNAATSAQASDNTPLEASIDLEVTKADQGLPTRSGSTIAYDIGWENLGNQVANGVEVTETVPTGTTFDAPIRTTGWVCTPDATAGSTCTFPVGTLGVGATGGTTFKVIVDNPVDAGLDTIDNTVTITDDGTGGVDDDLSNNVASTATVIDNGPPIVTSIDASPSVGGIASCSQVGSRVTQLTVELEDATGIADAAWLASYMVVVAGADHDLDTAECGPVFGDDKEVPIDQILVTGDPTNPTATLQLSTVLDDGVALLLVCDSLVDLAGNALDGDESGEEGGDFVRQFRVERRNDFDYAHFDNCSDAPITLAPWQANSLPPNVVTTTLAVDRDDSSLSGAIDIRGANGQPITVAQCIDVPGGDTRYLNAWMLIDGAQATDIDVELWCAYADQPSCIGLGAPEVLGSFSLAATGFPEWSHFSSSGEVSNTVASASCGVSVVDSLGGEFRLFVDDLFTTGAIFLDGFESGDLSSWSSMVP